MSITTHDQLRAHILGLEAEIAWLRESNAELLAACEAVKQPYEFVWITSPTRNLIDIAIHNAKHRSSPAAAPDPSTSERRA